MQQKHIKTLTLFLKKLAAFINNKRKLTTKETIEQSTFFEENYYQKNSPDMAQSELSAIDHYMLIGAKQNRNPSKNFNAEFYKIANPEYLRSTQNPLQHYLLEGKSYGALTCPVLTNNIDDEIPLETRKKLFKHRANKKLKIAFFSHNLNLEGAPLVCKDIAIAMQKTGNFGVTIFSPTDGILRKQLETEGIKVVIHSPFNKIDINSNKSFEGFVEDFANTLKEYNFDIIYGNTILSFWLMHIAKYLHLPSVFHIHESEPINYHIQSKKFDFVPLIVEALNLAQKVVFVADDTSRKYQPYQQNKNFTVIKNAFDPNEIPALTQTPLQIRESLNIKEQELMLLSVGTVANRKGQVDIVNALNLLDNNTLAKVHFVIVGDIDTRYSQYLHKRVKTLPNQITSRVHFIKKTPHVFDYYNSADICIFSSRIESYPKAIQEAMHYQLPIISTPVDGISEQLKDQHSGLFYQAGDAETLAKLITLLSNDKALRETLGSNAYSTLQTMISPKEMMNEYAQLFQEANL